MALFDKIYQNKTKTNNSLIRVFLQYDLKYFAVTSCIQIMHQSACNSEASTHGTKRERNDYQIVE